jgi:hypothetical protein
MLSSKLKQLSAIHRYGNVLLELIQLPENLMMLYLVIQIIRDKTFTRISRFAL